jgi:hypothetical protein
MLFALALSSGIGQTSALASPIRNHHQHIVRTNEYESIQAYFRHALRVHSLHVHAAAHDSVRAMHTINGLLQESPLVDYLRWRRSLNPARFDRFHPHIGHTISVDQQIRHSLAHAPTMLPPPAPPSFNPRPQDLTPPACHTTPEPSGWVIATAMLAAAAWARRFRQQD